MILSNIKKYNRDVLKEYSPCVLGYIDNFRLNKNYIVAEVLYMLRKEILFIKERNVAYDCPNYPKGRFAEMLGGHPQKL